MGARGRRDLGDRDQAVAPSSQAWSQTPSLCWALHSLHNCSTSGFEARESYFEVGHSGQVVQKCHVSPDHERR